MSQMNSGISLENTIISKPNIGIKLSNPSLIYNLKFKLLIIVSKNYNNRKSQKYNKLKRNYLLLCMKNKKRSNNLQIILSINGHQTNKITKNNLKIIIKIPNKVNSVNKILSHLKQITI